MNIDLTYLTLKFGKRRAHNIKSIYNSIESLQQSLVIANTDTRYQLLKNLDYLEELLRNEMQTQTKNNRPGFRPTRSKTDVCKMWHVD